MLTFRDTTSKQDSSPSFRWDTFVNYGEVRFFIVHINAMNIILILSKNNIYYLNI